MSAGALAALFAAVALLPLLPGLVELRARRDAGPLPIGDDPARDPRAPGRRVREAARSAADHPEGATVVEGDARIVGGAQVEALVCGGAAVLGQGAEVEVLDAQHSITAARGCSLGESAATGGALELGPGTRFRRLWGLPIVTVGDVGPAPRLNAAARTIEDELVWAHDRLSLPAGSTFDHDAVVRGDVRIGEGCVLRGSVKAHGSIRVLAGARVEGSLFAHRDIEVVGDAEILGNVFAERDVDLGPGTTIGLPGGYKTALAGRRMVLSPGVVTFGAVVAARGGRVR